MSADLTEWQLLDDLLSWAQNWGWRYRGEAVTHCYQHDHPSDGAVILVTPQRSLFLSRAELFYGDDFSFLKTLVGERLEYTGDEDEDGAGGTIYKMLPDYLIAARDIVTLTEVREQVAYLHDCATEYYFSQKKEEQSA